jgi:hypothetical protein
MKHNMKISHGLPTFILAAWLFLPAAVAQAQQPQDHWRTLLQQVTNALRAGSPDGAVLNLDSAGTYAYREAVYDARWKNSGRSWRNGLLGLRTVIQWCNQLQSIGTPWHRRRIQEIRTSCTNALADLAQYDRYPMVPTVLGGNWALRGNPAQRVSLSQWGSRVRGSWRGPGTSGTIEGEIQRVDQNRCILILRGVNERGNQFTETLEWNMVTNSHTLPCVAARWLTGPNAGKSFAGGVLQRVY